MVGVIMQYIRNFFRVPNGKHYGTYTIKDGSISLPFILEGQWILIEGSKLLGKYKVCQYPVHDLNVSEETFNGCITELNPDPEFIELCHEIAEWKKNYGNQAEAGPIVSESFDGYSYSKGTNSSGTSYDWKDIYKNQLRTWRKI